MEKFWIMNNKKRKKCHYHGAIIISLWLMCRNVLYKLTTCYLFTRDWANGSIYSSRHLRSPANIVIMNLAISDFFMLVKMPVFLYNSLLQGPALGMKGIIIIEIIF